MLMGAFVAILRNGGGGLEILLADRDDGKGFNLIGGKVEEGEEPEEAAEREAEEETGLTVSVHRQIGEDILGMRDGEHGNTIHLYAAEVVGGMLKKTEESRGFVWASIETLDQIRFSQFTLVYPSCPRGVTYEMARRALEQKSAAVLSAVPDPQGLSETMGGTTVVERTLRLPASLDNALQAEARKGQISVEELITQKVQEIFG